MNNKADTDTGAGDNNADSIDQVASSNIGPLFKARLSKFINDNTTTITLLVGLLAIHFIFIISPVFRRSSIIDAEGASNFGEFTGGYIGTILALFSVVFLIKTLRAQIEAGRDQKEAAERQAFENKYFTMLSLHRDNVAEMELGKSSGRKVFVLLLREWREILRVISNINPSMTESLGRDKMSQIAYYCLFYGVGPNSTRMLKSSLHGLDEDFIDDIERIPDDEEVKSFTKSRRKFGYTPFEGHQSRLGHYYRHLYQTIGYIDEQDINIDKYSYAKTVRAQLSTHEQALLLLNSITSIGKSWWTKGFMNKYKMVQNIPENFFESNNEVDISDFFDDTEPYFEWQKHRLYPNT